MHILVIEDRPEDCELLAHRLKCHFTNVQLTEVSNESAFRQALEEVAFDLVLTDYMLGWTDGLQILRAVKARFPTVPVVMFTESGSEEIAVQGMHEGLSDYLLKKQMERLPAAIQSSLEQVRWQRELNHAVQELRQSRDELEAHVRERTAELAAANTALAAANAALQAEAQEREQLLVETRHQAAVLEAALAAIPSLVLIQDAEGRLVQMNAVAERVLGHSTKERALLAQDRALLVNLRFPGEERELRAKELPSWRARHGEIVDGVLMTMQPRAAAQPIPYLVSAAPIRMPDSRTAGAVVTMQDVSPLLAMQAQMEEINSALQQRNAELQSQAQELHMQGEELEVQAQELHQRAEELQASEQTLQETRDYLDNLLTYANAPIIVWDPDLRITRFNKAFERLTGRQGEEVLGRFLHLLFPTDRRLEAVKLVRRTAEGERWEAVEIPIQRVDGMVRTVLWNSATLYAADGKTVVATIAQGQDITERKQTEEENRRLLAAVQQERDRLSALVSSMSDEVWFADTEKRFTLLNPAVVREFRMSPERAGIEQVTASLEIYRPDGTPRPVDEAPMLRALRGQVVTNLEEVIRTPATGELRWREVNATSVRNAGGAIIGSVAVVRDITDRKQAEEALRQSEERFRMIFEQAALGIAIGDMQGRVVESNPAMEKVLGYTKDELQLKSFAEFTHPDDVPAERPLIQELIAGQRDSYEVEKRYLRKDGETIWVRLTSSLLRGPGGEPMLGVALIEDITERRRAEEALQESREQFRSLVENLPSLVMRYDRQFRLVYLCPQAEMVTGLPSERLLGKTNREMGLPEELCVRWDEAMDQVFRTGERRELEYESPGVQGPGAFHLRLAPERAADGSVGYVLGLSTDITARKQAEQSLRESEERFRLALQGSDITVATLDTSRRYTWVYNTRHGFSPEQTVGKRAEELLPLEEVAETVAQQKQVLETGLNERREVRRVTGEKEWFYDSIMEPLRDESGRVTGLTYVAVDITKRRQAEQEREDLLRQQGQLLEQAQKDAETRATLLQEINHRVKNNLSAIVGLIYAQLDRPEVRDQPAYRAVLGDLVRWVQGLSVVHGMLSAARWAALPLDSLVNGVVQSCLKTVLPIKVAVQVQCPPLPIPAEQAQALTLAINEFVVNAIKHALGERRAGQLVIVGTQEGNEVLLTMYDDGPGYPEDVLAGTGLGVGLGLVRNLVRQNLRGRLTLRNEEGAVAEVRFPLGGGAGEKAVRG